MTTEEFKTNPPEPNGAKLIAGLREFVNMYPQNAHQALFNHLSEEHGLVLVEHELREIIRLCKDVLDAEFEQEMNDVL